MKTAKALKTALFALGIYGMVAPSAFALAVNCGKLTNVKYGGKSPNIVCSGGCTRSSDGKSMGDVNVASYDTQANCLAALQKKCNSTCLAKVPVELSLTVEQILGY